MNFGLVDLIRKKSGAEWDSLHKMGDIPEDAWADLIKVCQIKKP